MKMKKFINNPENLTAELLEGFALSNPDTVELVDGLIVSKALKDADRVTVVSMGGTGHEPALSGFTGEGILDITIPGDVFAAPGPEKCLQALKMADKGHGVLYIVLNHEGDMLTGNLTMKKVKQEGMNVIKVVTQEDIANAPREESYDRRGLIGALAVWKIAAAAAAQGKSLEEVAAIAQAVADDMATLAVAARGATHPATGALLATLGEDEIEIGMGQHCEGGGGRMPMLSADEVAVKMADALIADLGLKKGEKILVFINGSGATTLMEMLIVYRKVFKHLQELGIEIVANEVDELLTVQEQAGFQMSFIRMQPEWVELWNAPCNAPYFKKF